MVICTVEVNEKSPQTIMIGRRGTYNTQEIVFDIGYLIDAYGAGTAVLAVKRSQDSSAYPTVVTQEDTTLTWTVSETDTYYVGAGECQLMWYVDGGLAKTIIYPLVVMRDILSTSEEAPDAYQEWVDNLTALGAETLQNARDAAQSASDAESAKDDAVTAKEAAENAQEGAEAAQQAAETAVTHYPKIVNNYWYVWANGEWVNTGVKAEGVDGRGIVSVAGEKTATSGNVDTYTMTVAYTSGNPDAITFTVTNGTDGYSPVVTITTITGGHRVTITDETHPSGQSFDVMDGEDGASDAGDVTYDPEEDYDEGTVGAELSQQKNAIRVIDQIARDMIYTVPHSDIIQGTYNTNGSVSPSSTRIRVNKPLLLRKNDVLLFTGGEKASNIFLGLSSNGTTFTDDKWEYKKYIWYFTEDKYVIPVFKNDSGSSISPSDYDATLQIISLVNREMDKNLTVTDLFVLQNVNLFNKNDPNLVQGAYINTSPLAKIEKSASACVTGFIPVQPGKNYKLHIYSSTSSAYVTLYDANHQPYDYIARAKLQDANNHYYINMAIGENSLARFVRYNVPVDGLDYCMFVESAASEDMPSYIAYNNSVYPLPQNIKITNRYEITMEGGGFESTEEPTVSINDYNNYNRTAFYVDIKNASALSVDIDELTISSLTMRYYDSSMTLISKISVSSDFGREFAVLNQTKYIRFSMACTEKINAITIAVTGNEESIEEIPRTQKGSPADKCTYHVYGDVITTSRLLLPSIYTAKGTPVPLVLWMDGSGNFTKWNDGFSQSKLPYLQYLADEGFAVFSVFAWGNEYLTKYSSCGNSYPYPIPINLECIKKGIEYVCSRYNIDKDNIHIMSKSQGGQVALYYASKPDFNIRSIGMFAPVLDYLSMPGSSNYADTRKAIADELEMVGDTQYFGSTSFDAYSNDAKTFWLTNLEKINGMNEAWTLLNGQTLAEKYADAIDSGERYWADKTVTDIYQNYDLSKMAFIPVKIWGAADDNETPYMKMVEAIKQLSNGGTEAYLRTFPNNTGKHNCADLGTNVEASITAANGTVYTNLPSGWYENVLWMRSKMPIR